MRSGRKDRFLYICPKCRKLMNKRRASKHGPSTGHSILVVLAYPSFSEIVKP